jgi:hypothetical protein
MNMISLSQGHCCSTTLCNKNLERKGCLNLLEISRGGSKGRFRFKADVESNPKC